MEREEKVTLLKRVHLKILVFEKKVLFLIICGKNLTDACIGYIFLTDAFASIASAWIRPCPLSKTLDRSVTNQHIKNFPRSRMYQI